MVKTRISISLEQEQAERIRRHAERAGMDVSAYLVHAATRQMAETKAMIPVGSEELKALQRQPTGPLVCVRPMHPRVQVNHEDVEGSEGLRR